MYRGTTEGRHGYYCKACHHVISDFEDVLIEEFLHQEGGWMRWSKISEVDEDRSASSREDRAMLRAKETLRDLRVELREQPGRVVSGGTVGSSPA